MCGIAGLVNRGDPALLQDMTDIQRHRGPDDEGIWYTTSMTQGFVGLGSRRLAIQDLSRSGHMPMSTEDGRLTIVYNGEIYNSPELRAEMEATGQRFRSRSDTEVILRLYQRFGTACLERLNGIFAIAIWDDDREELFLARDHLGIKPLYYWIQGDRLAFASEVKAILVIPEIERTIDPEALRLFLTFLWVPEPLTMFAGIAKLPAGHFAIFREGRWRSERYWTMPHRAADATSGMDEREVVDEVRRRFLEAVRAQLISDVPVGAFLSAGLDSSSIVAAMASQSSDSIRTYTIDFPAASRRGEIMDDSTVARRTSDHFGCIHTELIVEPDVASLLPKLVWHMDDPTADPAIITAYLVAKEAKASATVLFSGVGGDELFAGYRKYQAHDLAERYRRLPTLLRRGVIEPLVRQLPTLRGTPIRRQVRLAKKLVRGGSLTPRERFIGDSVYLDEDEQAALLSGSERARWSGDVRRRHRSAFEEVDGAAFLDQMLGLDLRIFMPSLNLNYNDKMGMASSVETRVPFLDREFVEWVGRNVPTGLKLNGGQTKYVFRRAMEPLLPAEVLRQPKAGFGAPIDHWLANDLRPIVDDLLSPAAIAARGIFEPSTVRRYVDDQRSGRRDRAYQVWTLLTLEMWMQGFIDR